MKLKQNDLIFVEKIKTQITHEIIDEYILEQVHFDVYMEVFERIPRQVMNRAYDQIGRLFKL